MQYRMQRRNKPPGYLYTQIDALIALVRGVSLESRLFGLWRTCSTSRGTDETLLKSVLQVPTVIPPS